MKENELLERVKEVVQQFADPSCKVEAARHMKDLGLESIQIIEMLCEIEDAFDLLIGERAFRCSYRSGFECCCRKKFTIIRECFIGTFR